MTSPPPVGCRWPATRTRAWPPCPGCSRVRSPRRDPSGSHALVRPGDVDIMIAGSGITHSEYSVADTTILHGVQLWYALPDRARFRGRHFEVSTPPEIGGGGARVRV